MEDYNRSNIVIINYKNYSQSKDQKYKPKIVPKREKVVEKLPESIPKQIVKLETNSQKKVRFDPVVRKRGQPNEEWSHRSSTSINIKKLPTSEFLTSKHICTLNVEDSYCVPIRSGVVSGGGNIHHHTSENSSFEDEPKRPFPWRASEDEKLLYLYERTPENWVRISDGFTAHDKEDCRKRFQAISSKKIEGRWTKEEIEMLTKYYKVYGNKWKLISAKLPTRTAEQIKDKVRTLNKGLQMKTKTYLSSSIVDHQGTQASSNCDDKEKFTNYVDNLVFDWVNDNLPLQSIEERKVTEMSFLQIPTTHPSASKMSAEEYIFNYGKLKKLKSLTNIGDEAEETMEEVTCNENYRKMNSKDKFDHLVNRSS